MLKQPPFPEDESDHAARMYLSGDNLIVKLNAVALANFRWSLWWLATTCPCGEDIGIWAEEQPEQHQDPEEIGYCEITLAGEGPVFGKLHNPNAEFLHRDERIDLFVNRSQVEVSCQSLEAFSGTVIGQNVLLFGRLLVRVAGTRG